MSHMKNSLSHIQTHLPDIFKESCLELLMHVTYECVMSHIRTHMNESCHTYKHILQIYLKSARQVGSGNVRYDFSKVSSTCILLGGCRSMLSFWDILQEYAPAPVQFATLSCSATLCNTLQRTAMHCDILTTQTATRCNRMQVQPHGRACFFMTYCNTLQHTATHCKTIQHTATHLQHTHCNTLHHIATHCKHTVTHCNTLQHTAPHCNTLHHTASHCTTLQHTATHCNTLQHTATHCNTLQHAATNCKILQHTATHCTTLQLECIAGHAPSSLRLVMSGSSISANLRTLWSIWVCNTLQHTSTHCNTLQHTAAHLGIQKPATHCNTLQHTATRCNTLQHTADIATHCNMMQHIATYCNTLQHTAVHLGMQQPATHCNTLQHTAKHCNTLQHTTTHCKRPTWLI